jgi:hypothetical protein
MINTNVFFDFTDFQVYDYGDRHQFSATQFPPSPGGDLRHLKGWRVQGNGPNNPAWLDPDGKLFCVCSVFVLCLFCICSVFVLCFVLCLFCICSVFVLCFVLCLFCVPRRIFLDV